MAISIFNLIGLILLFVMIVAGTILKIVLKKRREKLEGFHGYVQDGKDEEIESKTDDWELL
ncbi:MAG: hypothetical protein FWE25_02540 [Lachnospiraceae bacterium]|nr:hypothetical protein [Lachnospiraceae bacterium]